MHCYGRTVPSAPRQAHYSVRASKITCFPQDLRSRLLCHPFIRQTRAASAAIGGDTCPKEEGRVYPTFRGEDGVVLAVASATWHVLLERVLAGNTRLSCPAALEVLDSWTLGLLDSWTLELLNSWRLWLDSDRPRVKDAPKMRLCPLNTGQCCYCTVLYCTVEIALLSSIFVLRRP
jgi:hypothetical protein